MKLFLCRTIFLKSYIQQPSNYSTRGKKLSYQSQSDHNDPNHGLIQKLKYISIHKNDIIDDIDKLHFAKLDYFKVNVWLKDLLLWWSVSSLCFVLLSEAFSLFSLVSFPNEECTTDLETEPSTSGLCLTASECSDAGGTLKGNCASSFGVCCFISVSATDSVISNVSKNLQNTQKGKLL